MGAVIGWYRSSGKSWDEEELSPAYHGSDMEASEANNSSKSWSTEEGWDCVEHEKSDCRTDTWSTHTDVFQTVYVEKGRRGEHLD